MNLKISELRVVSLLLTGLLAQGSCARALRERGAIVSADHVKVRMISGARRLTPGATQEIGVLFSLASGWHLYGRSRSDSGLPILLAPSAPEGFRFARPLWPAPRRLVSDGEILDHVYEHEVTILLPLEVPADAVPGRMVTLRCHADWLLCNTGCIPGQGDLEIELPIGRPGESPGASPDEAHLRAARSRLPAPQALLAYDVTSAWSREEWSIHVPGARKLEFYPDSSCAPLKDPIADGASSGESLRLRLAPDAPADAHVTGILAVKGSEREARFYQIDSASSRSGTQESVKANSE